MKPRICELGVHLAQVAVDTGDGFFNRFFSAAMSMMPASGSAHRRLANDDLRRALGRRRLECDAVEPCQTHDRIVVTSGACLRLVAGALQ